jgi:hypothetical protein
VGIGTSSPSKNLHVYNGTTNRPALIESGDADSLIEFKDNSTTNAPAIGATGNNLVVQTGSSATERMRIDSSGNLLVGKTAASSATVGFQAGQDGFIAATRASAQPLVLNRTTNDGIIADFRKDGTTVGSIGTRATYLTVGSGDTGFLFNSGEDIIQPESTTGGARDGAISLGASGARFKDLYLSGGVKNNGSVYIGRTDLNTSLWIGNSTINPGDSSGVARDNAIDLGYATARFDDIYATNGTIQTSDRNEKQDIAELSGAEQRVAVACKGLLRKFRWKDSVAEKGDDARIHFGIIAQDLQAAFAAEGLDAGDYAMFISTTWTDEETNEEKTRMGVRYSELLAFIIAAL